jgi:4a-hydroxytetrahydrobiopterin dehydratase
MRLPVCLRARAHPFLPASAFRFLTPAPFSLASPSLNYSEWFNVYNKVVVTLATHDCDGLSMRDVSLATYMDAAADRRE